MIKRLLNNEIFRFLVVGVLATLIDLIVRVVTNSIIGDTLSQNVKLIISFSLGFIISLIVNYVLSGVYVFKNKRKLNDVKTISLFAITSIIAFCVGLGLFYLFSYLFSLGNYDITSFNIFDFFNNFTNVSFYLYLVSFIMQTLLTLTINFLFRKKIIYR